MIFGEGTAVLDCNHEECDTKMFIHVPSLRKSKHDI